jgi:tetratricopeptide (TPR) repeat protein
MRKSILTLFICLLFLLKGITQNNDPHFKKAGEYIDKKEFALALQELDKALIKEPLNPEYLTIKGNVLNQLEKYKEAYEVYSKAIDTDPKFSYAYNQRALLLMKFRETEVAIHDLNTALAYEKNDTVRLTLLLNRGVAQKDIRNFKEAYQDFIDALAFDSANIGTLNNLAAVCDEVGKGDQTLVYLSKILSIDSTFIGAWVNIGFKYQEMGKHDTAIRYFNKALQLDPNEPLTYNNRAYSKLRSGDIPGALSDVNRSIKLYPGNSFAFRNRALIYLAMKRNTDACSDIEQALKLGFTKMYGDEVEKLKKDHCEDSSVEKTEAPQ